MYLFLYHFDFLHQDLMQKNPHTEKFSLPDLIWFQSLSHDEESTSVHKSASKIAISMDKNNLKPQPAWTISC